MKNKHIKIDQLKIFLLCILAASFFFYYKIYIEKEDVSEEKVVVLPSEVTNVTWYQYDSLNTIKFLNGSFEYKDSDGNYINSCRKYTYDDEDRIISFDCNNFEMQLVNVTEYKMILIFNDEEVYTFYSSLDLVNYIIENNLSDITDDELKEIVDSNDFTISKTTDTSEYKNTQISKLSSINELSVDDLLGFKDTEEDAVILLINPNMSISSYDLIPIYISWVDKYSNYNFYYVNGNNLTVGDYDLLASDSALKDYLTGKYDASIIVFSDGEYKRVVVDVYAENDDTVFSCYDKKCDEVEIRVYDEEGNYDSMDYILGDN